MTHYKPVIPPDAQCYTLGAWYKKGIRGSIFFWDTGLEEWVKSSYKSLPCIPVQYKNIRDAIHD